MAGVEEIDQTGKHIADHLSAGADDLQCGYISLASNGINVLRAENSTIRFHHPAQDWAVSIASGFHRLFRDGRSRCHSLKATLIPATAHRFLLVDTDVPDFARTTIIPAMDASIRNYSSADPGLNLYENKMVNTHSVSRALLAQSHDVDIVIHDNKR